MRVVDALDLGLELDDPAPEVGVELVGLHLLEEHVELAPFEGAARRALPGIAHGCKGVAVTERLAQAQLRFLAAAVGLLGRAGAELPPRSPDLDLERAQATLQLGDQIGDPRHGRRS